MGYPRRILTPSCKSPLSPITKGKDYDLLNIFSLEGFYSDVNNDTIPDDLDTSIIIPQNANIEGIDKLASRLVMDSAGASFPILYLEEEI